LTRADEGGSGRVARERTVGIDVRFGVSDNLSQQSISISAGVGYRCGPPYLTEMSSQHIVQTSGAERDEPCHNAGNEHLDKRECRSVSESVIRGHLRTATDLVNVG
jgi:hypothetical protein